MAIADSVRELLAPVIESSSARLYDVEHHGHLLRVLVDADGGIDLAELARLSRAFGRLLDANEVISGRYTLEVSSPGLERPLRTPEHFRGAEGTEVRVKTRRDLDGTRRFVGVLASVCADGVVLSCDDGSSRRLGFDDIASARTVFVWSSNGDA